MILNTCILLFCCLVTASWGYLYGLGSAKAKYQEEFRSKAELLLRHSAKTMHDMRDALEAVDVPRATAEYEQLRKLINNLDLWFIRRFGAFIDNPYTDPRKK